MWQIVTNCDTFLLPFSLQRMANVLFNDDIEHKIKLMLSWNSYSIYYSSFHWVDNKMVTQLAVRGSHIKNVNKYIVMHVPLSPMWHLVTTPPECYLNDVTWIYFSQGRVSPLEPEKFSRERSHYGWKIFVNWRAAWWLNDEADLTLRTRFILFDGYSPAEHFTDCTESFTDLGKLNFHMMVWF